MIEKEFVSYEIASQLKEIGFNEECFNMYFRTSKNFAKFDGKIHKNIYCKGKTCSGITAPLYQQVISWFLERKIWISVFPIDNWNSWTFDIVMEDIMKPFYVCFDGKELEFSSYEEAREAAILKAIEEYKNLNIK